MYKEVLSAVEGMGIFPVISLIIFFVFFIGVAVWFIKADKKYLNKMSNLPLGLEENSNSNIPGNQNEIKKI